MASEVITCPYCNALVSNTAGTARLLCPRCGERIPSHASREDAIQTQPYPQNLHTAPAPETDDDHAGVPIPRRFSNRSILLTILTVMVTMGVVGFKMAWETVELRRANDLHLTKPEAFGIPPLIKIFAGLWMVGLVMLLTGLWGKRDPGPAPASPRARWLYGLGVTLAVISTMAILFSGPIRRRNSQQPAELASSPIRSLDATRLEGMRYLPLDTNLVAGVHVAELLQDPRSREFLDGFKIAALHFSPERLESWTGMKREDIEYVLVGLKVEEQLLPRTTIIARSLAPLDAEALREKLKGVPAADGKPGRFHFKIVGTALDGEARCIPEERLLIIGLTRGDLDAVPPQPHEGLTKLAPRLGTLLTQRIDKRARVWAAAQVGDWERTPATWWLNRQPESDRNTLKTVRSFATWILFEDPLVVRAEIESDDAEHAKALAKYLEALRTEEKAPFKVPTPMDAWVSLQGRVTAKAVQEAFQIK
jgi:hypothetical protein